MKFLMLLFFLISVSIHAENIGKHAYENILNHVQRGETSKVKLAFKYSPIDLTKSYSVNGEKNTLLFEAAKSGSASLVKFLLAQPRVEINRYNTYGQHPLFIAAAYGHTDVVKLILLDHRLDEKNIIYRGNSPMIAASNNGHVDVVRLFLSRPGFDVNFNDNTGSALFRAALKGHLGVVKLLVQSKRVDLNSVDDKGRTALTIAIDFGKLQVVKYLINVEKLDPNFRLDGHTPPIHRIFHQKNRVTYFNEFIKNPKVNIDVLDKKGKSLLYRAQEWWNETNSNESRIFVNILENAGAKSIYQKESQFSKEYISGYCESGNIDRLKSVLNTSGFDKVDYNINMPIQNDVHEWTCLHHAVRNGNIEMVDLLLSNFNGLIDVNVKDEYGRTPLNIALLPKSEKMKIAGMLLSNPDIDIYSSSTGCPTDTDYYQGLASYNDSVSHLFSRIPTDSYNQLMSKWKNKIYKTKTFLNKHGHYVSNNNLCKLVKRNDYSVIQLSSNGPKELPDLSVVEYLKILKLGGLKITDFSPLYKLKKLKEIHFQGTPISGAERVRLKRNLRGVVFK